MQVKSFLRNRRRLQGCFLHLWLKLNHFLFYRHGVNESLAQNLRNSKATVLMDCVFIGHRSLKLSEAVWCSQLYFGYHICLIPEKDQLENTIAFAFANSPCTTANSENNRTEKEYFSSTRYGKVTESESALCAETRQSFG